MIGRLRGVLLERTPNRVLLDVSGVGYEVHIPLSTFYALPAGHDPVTSLYVHTHVREDALTLFGFAAPDERSCFEMLLGISGIGPRLALAILSGIGVVELRQAVFRQDRERLQKIPGVGKKTAERLLLELRHKLGHPDEPGSSQAPDPDAGHAAGGGSRADALSALCNLGYSRETASRAVDGALRDLGSDATLERVLRDALSRLVR